MTIQAPCSTCGGLYPTRCSTCGSVQPPDAESLASYWTLDAALVYIRPLQKCMMESGWCVMLAGGVLNVGHSANDLDLLLYPRTRQSSREDALRNLPPDGEWSMSPVSDVYAYQIGSKRIEVIFQTWFQLPTTKRPKPACDCANPPPYPGAPGCWHVSEDCPEHG